MTVVAALVGYLIGSLPTAGLLGRLQGVNLRSVGSGNPGTANALRSGGPVLAALVLIVEAAKGYAAVRVGLALSDETGAITAALGAVTGNVYNVWYRFDGGKGLGISLGVLIGLWPAVVLPVLGVILVAVLLSRSAGLASLAAIAGLAVMAVLWSVNEWPTGGVAPTVQLVVLAAGMALVMVWKHWRDSPLGERRPVD